MLASFMERVWTYLDPGILLSIAIYYYFSTVFEVVFVDRSPGALLNVSEVRAKAFGRFWQSMTPPADTSDGTPPELGVNLVNLPGLMSTATGTVLELGPGSGSHTVYYTSPSLRSIYGVEPVSELHPALRKSAEAAGIGDKYHILHCGGQSESLIPALEKAGLLKDGAASGNGIFDTVVCVRTLCSVPDLSATIEMLYRLLRPGGRFIICEHVINQWRTSRKASMIGRGFQIFYMMLGWTFFIGDCCLNRDTAEMVKKIGELHGGWKTVELESTMEWSALPFVTGVFVKRD